MTLPHRLIPWQLRLRILAGRAYAAAYGAVGRALARLPQDSALVRLKRRLAPALRPEPRKKVMVLYAVLARLRPAATFVQIGANDGVMSDPLRDFVLATRWRGVLVEPVPYLFERLRRNYAGRPGLSFENAAIADAPGTRPFYFVPDDGRAGPDWQTGLGSFLRETLVAHRDYIPDLESRLQVLPVRCMTFAELCERHGLRQFEILNIDAEGYDYEIIRTIDFTRHRPLLLVYESHLLQPADREACAALLRRAGYEMHEEGLDAICINVRDLAAADAPLHEAWKVLRDAAGVPA